jgi:UDP-GlcNAc:undecaprenyl-phosphate GlcNAc-1-phosphate transferase
LNYNFSLIGVNLPFWSLLSGGFLLAFLITYISIPTIVNISNFRKLFDVPNERTSHTHEVPILGGLSIFAGFTLSAVIFSLPSESGDIRYILGATVVLLLIGLKDDILIIDPKKKFFGQVLAAAIIVVLGDIRVTDFHSFLGIGEISYVPSILFSIFLLLTLINGFNLIDGVDGLSPGIGILTSTAFGIWFIVTGNFTYAVLCFSLAGSLIAYFRFNVFGGKNKIFMGDTGSMILGLLIAIFTVQFLECEKTVPAEYQFFSAPAAAFGLLIIPLFDTLRVVILRLSNGGSPFKADKNHVHHSLLKLGYPHLKVTLIIISGNIFFLLFVILFQGLGNVILTLLILVIALLLTLIPVYFLRKREKKVP